jgi:two-component system, NarL family, sensor histidine kinase DevS
MNDLLIRLRDIATSVSQAAEAGTVEQVLENIAKVSQELVGARYAALGVPNGKGGLKYFKVTGLTPEEIRSIGHLPIGKGLIGAIMAEGESLRLEDMHSDKRAAGFCEGHPLMQSLLGVPIKLGARTLGTLYLCDRADGEPFSQQDQWMVESMASYAALAIAGSQISEQHSRLALLEERERIGMELHDGVIQSLYAIGMQLELARISGDLTANDLSKPIQELNTVIEDIRRYILNLKAIDQRQQTVHEAFASLISRLHIPDTIRVKIDASDEYPPLTPAIFEGICQITNEAISNAVRHAEAKSIRITARESDQLFDITVADDGKGFDTAPRHKHEGLGLHNMRQRAMLYNGHVTIDSTPGGGTRVIISIPI